MVAGQPFYGEWTALLILLETGTTTKLVLVDYKVNSGFGNQNIYDLTKPQVAPKKSQLLINMLVKGKPVFALYESFEIGSEAYKYILRISTSASGNVSVPNSFGHYHNNMKFSTYDSDNDRNSRSCSQIYGNSGWWFNTCHVTLLTGVYDLKKPHTGGIVWRWNDKTVPSFVEMKIRRKD
ncbi:ficolin-2-like [Clytia hemisphaerica]|uniref:Fibrinogen C-terminal domain-containing protein n=1 Tax=Clytia hemisphaerica TaxID=252671 RepID=A0A7M5VC94_9CNID